MLKLLPLAVVMRVSPLRSWGSDGYARDIAGCMPVFLKVIILYKSVAYRFLKMFGASNLHDEP
jgi:hypothetical protein